jgi:hypothetical protein
MVESQGSWPGATSPPGLAPAAQQPGWGPAGPPRGWAPAAQQPGWAPAGPEPPAGWIPATPPSPSGLFPGHPVRPVYREPHPVATASVLAGIGSTLIWLALFGSIGRDLVSYAWWTLVAAVTAWVVALVLTTLGDRGVATGVAATAGFGLSVAIAFVATRWITTDNWPMW